MSWNCWTNNTKFVYEEVDREISTKLFLKTKKSSSFFLFFFFRCFSDLNDVSTVHEIKVYIKVVNISISNERKQYSFQEQRNTWYCLHMKNHQRHKNCHHFEFKWKKTILFTFHQEQRTHATVIIRKCIYIFKKIKVKID